MKTIYGDNSTRFSAAITAVAKAIRTSPENRKHYNPIILSIADSLIEYEDARGDSYASISKLRLRDHSFALSQN